MGRIFGKATAPAMPDIEKLVPQIAYNPSPTLDEIIVPTTEGAREEHVVLQSDKPEPARRIRRHKIANSDNTL